MPTIRVIDSTGSVAGGGGEFFIPDSQFAQLPPSAQDRALRGLFSLLEAQRAATQGSPIDITSLLTADQLGRVAQGLPLAPVEIEKAIAASSDPRGETAPIRATPSAPIAFSGPEFFTMATPTLSIQPSLIGDIFGVVKKIPGVGGIIQGAETLGKATGVLPGTKGMAMTCPEGFKVDSKGMCVRAGLPGTIQRILPGGKSGTLGDVSGNAVVGAFGVPGLVPEQVGVINGGPILKCPAGMVLGKDDICYVRSVLPRQFRKWPRAARPPITAGDAKAIRKAESAKRRVKKLAGAVGFSCTRKCR